MFSARETASASPSISRLLSTSWVWTFKPGFDQPDVLIAGAKQAFDASADMHAGFHLGSVSVPPKGSKRGEGKTSGASRQIGEQIMRFRGVAKTILSHYIKRCIRL